MTVFTPLTTAEAEDYEETEMVPLECDDCGSLFAVPVDALEESTLFCPCCGEEGPVEDDEGEAIGDA